MKSMPRILPLAGVAIGGVLALNALAGARDLPNLISGARAFAEEAAKPAKGKGAAKDKTAKAEAETGEAKEVAAAQTPLPTPTLKPQAVCAPTAAELAKEAGLSPAELQVLRAQAAVAVVPSRYAEILPLAALESMAAALPTVAAASGGLTEAVPAEGLYPPGDIDALSDRLKALWRSAEAGERALASARERSAPEVIADQLRAVYGATSAPARY